MDLYNKLFEILEGGHSDLQRVAYSVIHKNCKLAPDLRRHYLDMEQTIYTMWLTTEVDETAVKGEIIKYAQHRARYAIQRYLMQFHIVVSVPKKSSSGLLDFSQLEYSNFNFDQEVTHEEEDGSADGWLKSAHYLTIDKKDSWVIWFLSEGFSIAQTGSAMGVTRAAINIRLTNIKKRHENL